MMTAAAMGILMKKTQCHDACCTSHPPSTGPKAVVIAVNPDHVPIAWPRDFSSNEALIIARLLGTRAAAPIPCTHRAITNAETLDARPHPADAIANRPAPEHEDESPSNRISQRTGH